MDSKHSTHRGIKRDVDFFEKCLQTVDNLIVKAILPEIVGCWYTKPRQSPLSDVTNNVTIGMVAIGSTSEVYCFSSVCILLEHHKAHGFVPTVPRTCSIIIILFTVWDMYADMVCSVTKQFLHTRTATNLSILWDYGFTNIN